MDPVFKVLDGVCCVLECIVSECYGDAKMELSALCLKLESDPEYAIDNADLLASELRQILHRICSDDRRRGVAQISDFSRRLWNVALDQQTENAIKRGNR